MTQGDQINHTLTRLKWPLRLTWAGLWAERLIRAFWPLWTVLATTIAALAFGVQDHLPLEAAWSAAVLCLAGAGWTLIRGLRQLRPPSRDEALIRLDAALPGRPIAALADTQAIGATDPASQAVWRAHLARMAALAAAAQPVPPDLRLARRDPFALRYAALTALIVALVFGSLWRVATVADLGPGGAASLTNGPVWEGWIQPPPHTGKPGLYLNDIDRAEIAVPADSRVTLRLYGEVGALTVAETLSGRAAPAPGTGPASTETSSQDFTVTQSGTLAIDGPGGRTWAIEVIPDSAPMVTFTGEMGHQADGRMMQAFTATDDYGILRGSAEITLDLASVDRRYGLSPLPEPRDPVVLDLPMPITGSRAEFTETLTDDLSKHPFANLPVTIRLTAEDASGQTGMSPPLQVILPGRRFFDPLAAAIIEMRRDLLWSRDNAVRVVQVVKALTHRPEGLFRNERAYLRLRVALRAMDAAAPHGLTTEFRDEMADVLWDIALMVEEGDLASALERLRRVQDRLSEAIKNGANEAEIAELMQDMREALNNYMRQLAEDAARNPDQQMSDNQDMMELSGDQLQQMLDRLQQLMEEGRMAEAAELMDALRQMMENMQVTQGGGGQQSPGQQGMRDLAETLRDQQGLSDDSFQQLQDEYNGGQGTQDGQPQPGEQGQEGQGTQQGVGREGQGQGRSLAERQRDLAERLNGLSSGSLPGRGSDKGDAGREALDQAGRAMKDAEEALRRGDLSGALDRQAEAMEALREGMRNLGEAQAEDSQRNNPDGQGEAYGRADPNSQRDPLGRDPGQTGRIGSDRNLLQGDDVYRRAQDLLDEIRRRSGDQSRPDLELDYLRRLLERF
jgi:uncharacterized protein (TIGR02302 family)